MTMTTMMMMYRCSFNERDETFSASAALGGGSYCLHHHCCCCIGGDKARNSQNGPEPPDNVPLSLSPRRYRHCRPPPAAQNRLRRSQLSTTKPRHNGVRQGRSRSSSDPRGTTLHSRRSRSDPAGQGYAGSAVHWNDQIVDWTSF